MRAIAASWLVFGDGERAPQKNGALVLDAAERIVAVGEQAALRARFADARWESHDAVLLPGLVNAHTHLELSALRGAVPGGAGFVPWVGTLLTARERVPQEQLTEAIDQAVSELIASGTVAIGEVTNTLAALPALSQSSLQGQVFHEVFGLRREVAQVMLQMCAQQRADVAQWPERFGYALAPHTPYSVHPELLVELVARARALGQRTTLHLSEHAAERAYLRDGSGPFASFLSARGADPADWAAPGLDSVRYVQRLGLLSPDLLCVHLADARQDEIAIVAASGATIVLCPRSNLHIEVRMPPLIQMLDAGMRPALGTDSLASSASLDVLEEARALHARFPSVAPRTLLAMATGFGADALGLGARLGRFSQGARPGVIAFNHEGPAPQDPERYLLSPRATSRRMLAYAADAP